MMNGKLTVIPSVKSLCDEPAGTVKPGTPGMYSVLYAKHAVSERLNLGIIVMGPDYVRGVISKQKVLIVTKAFKYSSPSKLLGSTIRHIKDIVSFDYPDCLFELERAREHMSNHAMLGFRKPLPCRLTDSTVKDYARLFLEAEYGLTPRQVRGQFWVSWYNDDELLEETGYKSLVDLEPDLAADTIGRNIGDVFYDYPPQEDKNSAKEEE